MLNELLFEISFFFFFFFLSSPTQGTPQKKIFHRHCVSLDKYFSELSPLPTHQGMIKGLVLLQGGTASAQGGCGALILCCHPCLVALSQVLRDLVWALQECKFLQRCPLGSKFCGHHSATGHAHPRSDARGVAEAVRLHRCLSPMRRKCTCSRQSRSLASAQPVFQTSGDS